MVPTGENGIISFHCRWDLAQEIDRLIKRNPECEKAHQGKNNEILLIIKKVDKLF